MSDNPKFGAIGEGRAIRKTHSARNERDSSALASAAAAPTSSSSARLRRTSPQPTFGVNICVELFGGNRIHKPMPRHSPCCKRYEHLRSWTSLNTEGVPFDRIDVCTWSTASEDGSTSERSINDSSNSPEKIENGLACGGRDSSTTSPNISITKLEDSCPDSITNEISSSHPGSSTTKFGSGSFAADFRRGCPDGEVSISDDFKQFLTKFKDLKVVWEEQAKTRDLGQPPAMAQREPPSGAEFGDSFDDCSQNVKMFFMKYAMTKTEGKKSEQK